MDEFYAQMEQRYKTALDDQDREMINRWKLCVEAAAVRGIPLAEVRCEVPVQPRRSTLDKLETPQLKLMAEYVPEREWLSQQRPDPAYFIIRRQMPLSWLFTEDQDCSKV